MTTVQQHHHTATCKKKGTFCRFNYPKLHSSKTLIAKELDLDDPTKIAHTKQRNKDLLSKVQKYLSQNDNIPPTVHKMLKAAGVSRKHYKEALKVTKHGITVVLQRSPKEINTTKTQIYLEPGEPILTYNIVWTHMHV